MQTQQPTPIQQWIDQLHTSDDPRERRTLLRRMTETVHGEDGHLRHEVVVALLWALRDNDPSVKRLAVAWLPRLDKTNPQVEDVAIAHIYNRDLRVREGATFFLWLISSKRCQSMMYEIVQTQDDRFPYKHWVFQLLSNQDIPVDILLQYLTDESALSHVLARLGEIHDERVVPALVAAINALPPSQTLRPLLLSALSRRDDVNINLIPHLRRWLKQVHQEEISLPLAELCRDHGGSTLTRPLLVNMQNEPAFILTLPQITYIDPKRKLVFLLDRVRIPELQNASIRALGYLGNPAAITPLMGYLRGNEEEVIVALANIGGAPAYQMLVRLLHNYWDDTHLLETIIAALGYVGEPAAAPHLVPLLHNPRPLVTAEAVRVLGELGNPAVIPDLAAKLDDHHDPDHGQTHGHTLSELAAHALEQIGTAEALAAIAKYREG